MLKDFYFYFQIQVKKISFQISASTPREVCYWPEPVPVGSDPGPKSSSSAFSASSPPAGPPAAWAHTSHSVALHSTEGEKMKAAFKNNTVLSKAVHFERHKGTELNPNMQKWVMKLDCIWPVKVLREKPSKQKKAQW